MGKLPTGIGLDKKTGLYFYRIQVPSPETGKYLNFRRTGFPNVTAAKEARRSKLDEIEDYGEKIIQSDRMKFVDLADLYRKRKLVPAVYDGEQKVFGLRSVENYKHRLKPLLEYFGHRLLKSITHADVEDFKQARFLTPKAKGGRKPQTDKEKRPSRPQKPGMVSSDRRSIAAVNRELQLLRAIFNFAKRENLLARSPFDYGDSLISLSMEKERDRILSHDEEKRLLAACTDRRAHLRALIVTALDTGMRRGELLKLEWPDLNFEARTITVRALNTKTLQERSVGMTKRVFEELSRLRELSQGKPGGHLPPRTNLNLRDGLANFVFGLSDNFYWSFNSACAEANIPNFRFHDLRHTFTTRAIQAGVPAQVVMKTTGHRQQKTFMRYMNVTTDIASQAARLLDKFNDSVNPSDGEDTPKTGRT